MVEWYIAHESNKENIDVDKLKFIYSDHIAVWQNGQKIEVYNLPVKSELREKFSREILGITAREAKSNEHNRVITNTLKNPHYEKQERMLLFRIAKNPNAIGYVGKDSIKGKSGIRIIHTIK